MFRSKTVFVLGAGASAEVGLPLGAGLLTEICRLINIRYDFNRVKSGDQMIADALQRVLTEKNCNVEYNDCLHAAWQVIQSASQALSIDNIVDGLEDKNVEIISKLGIVRAIHIAEKDSGHFRFAQNHLGRLDFKNFSKTWYDKLTKLICENRKKSEVENVFDNLSFISFNYDRCIERYLPDSIANYYGMDVKSILPMFANVKIHRPYGIAGILERDHAGTPRNFGGANAEYLAESARLIRTFTEGVEYPSYIEEMRIDLHSAERIVFLGSAFHRKNLELLKTEKPIEANIIATVKGISDADIDVIRQEFCDIFKIQHDKDLRKIVFAPLHCNELFESYWRTLTA